MTNKYHFSNVVCNLGHNLQLVEGYQYFVEVEVLMSMYIFSLNNHKVNEIKLKTDGV